MNAQDIHNKIDSIGSIKVIFEPSIHKADRIKRDNLESVISNSQISLRGWNFPHIPTRDDEETGAPYSIGGGKEFFTHWDRLIEIFRIYESGQFLARLALREDILEFVNGRALRPGEHMDFLGFIYSVTEIVLFIKNLIENTDIEGGNLRIEVDKTMDRRLESVFDLRLSLGGDFVCRISKILVSKEFDREKMLLDPLEIARELIKDVFYEFNWKNPSDQMIKTHQENLLNRRF